MSDFTYSVWIGDSMVFQSSDSQNAWIVYESWITMSRNRHSSANGKLIRLFWRSVVIDAFDSGEDAILAETGYFSAIA